LRQRLAHVQRCDGGNYTKRNGGEHKSSPFALDIKSVMAQSAAAFVFLGCWQAIAPCDATGLSFHIPVLA
jgi:hypothetical protein